MNKGAIVIWLRKYSSNTNVLNDEIQIDCPKCGHPNFYFNLDKKLGHCHRASCHWSPSLKALSKFLGSEPNDLGYTPVVEKVVQENKIITLPPSHPIVEKIDGKLMTQLPEECLKLQERGLTIDQIHHYGITADRHRIYVPVYYKGNLEQYVGRHKWWEWGEGPKYKYASGVSISKFLFGWDEQDWDWMTLVENTFVSIWLRDSLNCTTNFGSHLSLTQIDLIRESKIKNVIILWDKDAWVKAQDAARDLRAKGINSKFIGIIGQPDDYPKEFIIEMVSIARLSPLKIIYMDDACKAFIKTRC